MAIFCTFLILFIKSTRTRTNRNVVAIIYQRKNNKYVNGHILMTD